MHFIVSFTLLAFLCMQEYREKKMDKKEVKKPLTIIVFMAPINIQMVAMDI